MALTIWNCAWVYPVQSGYIQPVPSPGKRGGLGMGLTTPSRKKIIVTEINIRGAIIGGDGDDTSQVTGQMTDVNQTLQGVDTPTVDSLKPKAKTRIACWNVRTLYQTGKLAQVVREFHNYSLDILGVCEARWTGSRDREH